MSRTLETFLVFLKLGLTSFGGPIVHIAYFHRELVERRQWFSDAQYAQLLALCQFLPGPTSSQLGFALGLFRTGWLGALAAFVAFTLPSALMMFAFALLLPYFDGVIGESVLHGLKLVALAVVMHAMPTMIRQFCPDPARATIATLAAVVILLSGQAWVQVLVIASGAIAGVWLCRHVSADAGMSFAMNYGRRVGSVLLGLFVLLLIGLPMLAHDNNSLLLIADIFYRAGALVFGGGHVVLPLLEQSVVDSGALPADQFLAGYGATQAVPGPLFSFSVFLGANLSGEYAAITGALAALAMIFLPGFLLLVGILPFWQSITLHPRAAHIIAGGNAAVVGLLGAALYDPIWITAVRGPTDLSIALIGFLLLAAWKLSALWVVAWCVVANMAFSLWL